MSTWISHQKRRPEDGHAEWTKIRVNRFVKWTSHKETRAFQAPARNVQLPAITFKPEVEREKKLVTLQNIVGAQAAMTLELWDSVTRLV